MTDNAPDPAAVAATYAITQPAELTTAERERRIGPARYRTEHGPRDNRGMATAPAGTVCLGCGQNLPTESPSATVAEYGPSGLSTYYVCGVCACYPSED